MSEPPPWGSNRLSDRVTACPDADPAPGHEHEAMTEVRRIVGVYDADGGLRGEVAYIAGTFAGRHCSLCDITHSPVRRRKAWDAYVATLPVPFEVVHRNERTRAIAEATAGREACVVAQGDDGSVTFLLDNDDLAAAGDVAGLARALESALARAGLTWPRD
jgi:hypothetical protein